MEGRVPVAYTELSAWDGGQAAEKPEDGYAGNEAGAVRVLPKEPIVVAGSKNRLNGSQICVRRDFPVVLKNGTPHASATGGEESCICSVQVCLSSRKRPHAAFTDRRGANRPASGCERLQR